MPKLTASILLAVFSIIIAFPVPGYSYNFESAPHSITSPEELADWLYNEFSYEFKFPDHLQTPEETMDLRKGDCEDFAFLCRKILADMGVSSDVVVIKFSQLGIMHAVCMFKRGDTYCFMSNKELVRTRGRTIAEAISEKFPDWEKIAFMNGDGAYGNVIDRRYDITVAANNISAASVFGSLLGNEYKDMAMIKMVLQEQLATYAETRMPVNVGTFMTILKQRTFGFTSQVSIQFIFDGLELTPAGFRILCRARDAGGMRLYNVVFSMNRIPGTGFSVAVYTQEEWQRMGGFHYFTPHDAMRKPVNAQAGVVTPLID